MRQSRAFRLATPTIRNYGLFLLFHRSSFLFLFFFRTQKKRVPANHYGQPEPFSIRFLILLPRATRGLPDPAGLLTFGSSRVLVPSRPDCEARRDSGLIAHRDTRSPITAAGPSRILTVFRDAELFLSAIYSFS